MNLLINADDFGISDSVNLAIDYCFENNIIQRTSLIVNMDSSDSAVELAKEHGYSDKVGLHLNLIEGVPLSEPIRHTIFCKNGIFNGQALRRQKNRFFLSKQEQTAVVCELRMQIEKYIEYGLTLRHVDSHEHTHTNPSIFRLMFPLLKEYGFLSCRLSRNIPECEITGVKKIYKNIFNKKVNAFNKKKQCKQWNVTYFGSQKDVDKIATDIKFQKNSIEVEVHPNLGVDGKLKDLFYPIGLDDWIKRYR